MIIRFNGPGDLKNLKAIIKRLVPTSTVLLPLATETTYEQFHKVLANGQDNQIVVRALLKEYGFSIAEVSPRLRISEAMAGRLSYADRRKLAEKIYFIALEYRRSFVFTSKEHFDTYRRIDNSLLGYEALEAALPAGFVNYAEREFYYRDSDINGFDFLAGHSALRDQGFVELVRQGDQFVKERSSHRA